MMANLHNCNLGADRCPECKAAVRQQFPRVPVMSTDSYDAKRLGIPLHHPASVPWRLAELAHGTYAALYGGRSAQSLELIVRRGSFSWPELSCFMAGHDVGPPHDRSACMAAALQAVERDAVEAEKLRADRAETALEAMRKRVLELEAELRKRA